LLLLLLPPLLLLLPPRFVLLCAPAAPGCTRDKEARCNRARRHDLMVF